ncbi:MAG: hypothetical protein F4Y91_04655 [Gemmatimonadetes bacterium]|nr:hypothetical protein [Gemmatimonadota bacterium]MXY81359.1 hypothetical protein [Gemmatimonadota bacterium]MYB70269.1 hypothetical protein [Gemmatimonadota bacterium]
MSRLSKYSLGGALVAALALGAVAAKLRSASTFVVEASVENFRDAPKGTKLGTLLAGTEIESIGEEGQWVRFRVEGWVWGPSLEGYVSEEERDESREEPIPPLQDERPRIKELVNDRYGVFYGVGLDEDTGRLWLRFRVRDIEREAWERRAYAVQRGAAELLQGRVEFSEIRIETNRPDGSGEVGQYIAATAAADLARAEDDWEVWRQHTRFSIDGGETWEEAE